jgi:hypothetical protein
VKWFELREEAGVKKDRRVGGGQSGAKLNWNPRLFQIPEEGKT